MRPHAEQSTPTGHPYWITVQSTRTVLIIVHTMTAWNRLADILSIFDSDRRVQLVFSFPDVSKVTGDVQRQLAEDGAVVISWHRALSERFDAAISVHHSGDLHRINAPLTVLSHGLGYTKLARRETRDARRETRDARRETRDARTVYGLGREWLVRDGRVPDAIILPHEQDRVRLADLAPEALPNAVVAGDPCFDRLRASLPYREQFRKSLGAEPDSTVVTLSSTWGPGSLLGRHPNLIAEVLSELPMNDHIVTAVVHPNAWFAHGPLQLRLWLADALRSGLRLIPPLRGWQHTLLASDVVIGDHGAVTGYAAALGIPTLLAAFPQDEVAPGSVLDLLGALTPRLDTRRPLAEQIATATTGYDRSALAPITALVSSHPDECARILRGTLYRLMNLPEPDHSAPVFPYAAADLLPLRDDVRAFWLTCDWHRVGTREQQARIRRWPADVTARARRGPRAVDALLAVDSAHPRRDLRANADIVILPAVADREAEAAGEHTLAQRPACAVAAAPVGTNTIRIHHRTLGVFEALLTQPITGPAMVADIAAAVHTHHAATLPQDFTLDLAGKRVTVRLKDIGERGSS